MSTRIRGRYVSCTSASWLALTALLHGTQAAETAECGIPAAKSDGWQVTTQEAAGLNAAPLCALVEKLGNSPRNNVHGVVVVRGGRLVFEDYLDGPDQRWGESLGPTVHGPDVRHDVRSISKSVTSLLVGIAIDRKLIASVDEPVFEFFPEYASLRSPDKDNILLRHLLAMTSGLSWDENRPYSDPKNSEIQMIRSPDPYRFVLEQPISSTPDKVWNYSGGSTQLLAGIVQKVTGERLEDFAREALFEPLGITDYEWVRMGNGEAAAPSGLRLRPRDMAKIGQLLLNGGEWNGRRIVSAEWIQESIRPRLSSTYGYQWWTGLSVVGEQVIDRAEAKGLGGQRIFVVPSLDLVVVVTAGLYIKGDLDNEGEITNDVLDSYVLPAVRDLVGATPPSVELERSTALGHDPRLVLVRPAPAPANAGDHLEPAEAVGLGNSRRTMSTHRSRTRASRLGPFILALLSRPARCPSDDGYGSSPTRCSFGPCSALLEASHSPPIRIRGCEPDHKLGRTIVLHSARFGQGVRPMETNLNPSWRELSHLVVNSLWRELAGAWLIAGSCFAVLGLM